MINYEVKVNNNNVLGCDWATVFFFFFAFLGPFHHHQDENTDSGLLAQYVDVHLQSAAEGQHFTSISFTFIIYCESTAKNKNKYEW